MITKILELVRAIFVSKVDSDKRSIGRRKLTIETLESRELLSASPLGQVLSDLDELYSPVVCAPAISIPANASASSNAGQVSQAPPAPLSETFTLHSNPNSNFTIYLDFDGHVTSGTPWNEGFRDFVTPAFTMDADPNFSEAELEMIQYIWQRVSEDFMPFDVDVTTEAPPDNYLTKETPTGDSDGHWGVRVAIGGSSYDWLGDSAGGVALLGSFSWDTDTPCFAFNQYDEKAIAEAVSHEVGHTLGLSHDGDSTRGYEYYAQEGEATGWAPIMGAGYYSDVVQWSKGEYTGNTNTEDDLAIITGEITNESTGMFGGNGFTYRQDDHGNSIQSATELPTSENSFIVTGIVERNTDVDYFVIDITSNSVIDLKITSGSRDANLDILAKIYDSSGNVIETFNDQLTLHAEFLNLSLVAGVYYLSIEGTGREYISETMIGYTDYGSIGSYKIEATITREAEPLDSPTLEVTGVTTTTVSLDWSVVDGATGYLLQWSTNSSVWDVQTQVQFNSNETEYTVEGLESGTLYYFRVRAVSENAFSNWVMVQATTEREVIVDDDYEDNDSFDIVDAAVLDSEADHTPNLGVIEAERTINDLKLVDGNDYFKFEITSNGSADSYVRIAFDNSVGDIDFQLFDGNRNFVRSSSTTANSETISLNELNAGVYYVRIFSYRGAENPNYTLTIVPPTTSANEPPPANTTIENNNSFETAFDFGAITALTAIDGLELKAGEIADYYKFTFTATGDANSYARIDFTNANGDLAVQLFDSSRMSVKSMDTSKDYEKLNLNKLVAGTYYIKISGYRNAVNTYSLSINPPIESVVPPTPTPPATPSNVTATKTAQGQVSITWNSVADVNSYNIYRQDGQNLVLVATVSGTSYSVNELADGTYTFAVSAVSSNGESDKSTTSITLVSPPVAPSNLTATQTANGQIAITWNNVADVNSYNIYRQDGQNLVLVATVSGTSYSVNELADGAYTFAVSAVSSNGESVKNIVTINVVNEVIIDEPPTGVVIENNNTFETAFDLGAITALTTVDGLELKTGEVADYYKFTFTATGDANSYARIDFTNANGDLAVQLFDSSRMSVKSMDTSKDYEKLNLNKLVAGTYYIKISGYRNAVNTYSLSINPPIASVVPPTPTPPATPSNVTATKTAQGQVSITWNSVVDAASYNVYRQDGQNLVLVATVTGTSYSVNELADGTYTFVVSAVSSNGESGKSTASVTLVSPPVAPSSLTATQTANGQVALTWNNVADVNSYNVYRQTGQDLILVGTLTSNSCTFNDLDDGLHSFAISSVSDNGESVKNIVTINVVNEVVIDEPPVGSNYENNNTFETAVDLGAITALTSIDGLELKTGEIADYYKFTFTATGDANSYARIDFINANGDLAVQLFDSSRKSVKTMDTSKDYEKLNLNKLVAGTYYIKISGYRNAVNAYSLSINPPAVSVVSAPVNLSATLSVETNPVPALTGDYQVYADNSAIILNNTPQQNNYTYTNLSNQFFATPTEFLANAPVIEIIGHEVMEDGKIRLQWSVKDESGETSPIRVSEVTTADAGVFQISATFNYYSSGKIMTGIVKSNAYSLSNSALPQLVEMY